MSGDGTKPRRSIEAAFSQKILDCDLDFFWLAWSRILHNAYFQASASEVNGSIDGASGLPCPFIDKKTRVSFHSVGSWAPGLRLMIHMQF